MGRLRCAGSFIHNSAALKHWGQLAVWVTWPCTVKAFLFTMGPGSIFALLLACRPMRTVPWHFDLDSDKRPCCFLRQGYVLDRDGRTCTDVDECATQRHHCPHVCVNTPGSYTCQCEDGFRVEGRVCIGKNPVHVGPIHTGREHTNLLTIPLMLLASMQRERCHSQQKVPFVCACRTTSSVDWAFSFFPCPVTSNGQPCRRAPWCVGISSFLYCDTRSLCFQTDNWFCLLTIY